METQNSQITPEPESGTPQNALGRVLYRAAELFTRTFPTLTAGNRIRGQMITGQYEQVKQEVEKI